MKKLLSNKKTSIILAVITVVVLAFYIYMLARPISYGMTYHNEMVYAGQTFEGIMKFKSDNTVLNDNTNFDEEITSRYYYKNGYVFFTLAETDEEYEEEIAMIDENFDEAVESPFYAAKINAFKQTYAGPDGYTTIYTCKGAIIFAIAGGVVSLALIALTASSLILSKKAKSEK